MDNQFFLNHPGMPLPPSSLQFDHPTMPTWQSLSSSSAAAAAMDIHMMTIPSSSADHLFPHQSSPDHCFFDSALSSMVSSPTTTNTNVNGFAIKELIGRLGNIYTGPGDLSPPSSSAAAVIVSSCNNSCYNTPLSSPKMVQHQQSNVASSDHFPAPANYPVVGGNSLLPAMPGDPGFAERAARFSSFGSRSFNGRSTTTTTTTTTINNGILSPTTGGVSGSGSGFPPKSPGGIGGGRRGAKLQRVLSSPSLKVANHNHHHNNNNGTTSTVHEGEAFTTPDRKTSRFGGRVGQFGNSREENGDVVAVVRGSSSSRKRKSSSSAALQKGKEEEQQKEDCSDAKRCKEMNNKTDEEKAREEEEEEVEEISNKKKQSKSNNNSSKDDTKQKKIIDEAPKDYIHVRARRGQATDSHSLAERVRREKISERMKLLQDLVPGCNKVVGKALMLEEIINYVQSLQRQVEFLSMKLATVNPRMEFNTDSDNANTNTNTNVFRKDPDWSMQHQQQQEAAAGGYPMTQTGYGGHAHHQSLQQQLNYHHHQQEQQSVVDIEIPMHHLINNNNNGFSTTDHHHHTVVPELQEQLPSLCEGDDLEAIVEMGRRLISTHSTTDVEIQ